jgi:hypothetical protein
MTELLRNASLGWADYKGSGKLAILLLAALMYLWFAGKWRKQKALVLYTTVAAVCCILPVTAALLMLYQTKFYDYQWIWSIVPLTAVTAYGATLFLEQQWRVAQGPAGDIAAAPGCPALREPWRKRGGKGTKKRRESGGRGCGPDDW